MSILSTTTTEVTETTASSPFLLFLLLLLAVFAGIIILQIFLSKKENKWLGFILPIFTFVISLTALMGVLLFSANTGTLTLTKNGEVIEQTTTQVSDLSSIIWSAVYIFILYNIPTVILLVIYAVCRSSRNKKRELDKMSVQDL